MQKAHKKATRAFGYYESNKLSSFDGWLVLASAAGQYSLVQIMNSSVMDVGNNLYF